MTTRAKCREIYINDVLSLRKDVDNLLTQYNVDLKEQIIDKKVIEGLCKYIVYYLNAIQRMIKMGCNDEGNFPYIRDANLVKKFGELLAHLKYILRKKLCNIDRSKRDENGNFIEM